MRGLLLCRVVVLPETRPALLGYITNKFDRTICRYMTCYHALHCRDAINYGKWSRRLNLLNYQML